MYRGYIKLWRKIRDNELWTERRVFSRFEAWTDLLMEAHWDKEKPKRVTISGRMYEIGYGEILWSVRFMAARWKWSNDKVLRSITCLKNEYMLRTETSTGIMKITILNYEQYHVEPNSNKYSHESENRTLTERSPNEKKKSKENQEAKKERKPKEDFVLPEWLDPQTWYGFEQNRKALRAPLTDLGRKQIIKKLEELKTSGTDPNESLLQSIERGWKGVFEINRPLSSDNKGKPGQLTRVGEKNYAACQAFLESEKTRHAEH